MAIARGRLGELPQADLALAEEALLRGDVRQARMLAGRAAAALPPGPVRLRAQDIVNATDPTQISRLVREFDRVRTAGAAAATSDRLVWLVPGEFLAVAGHEPREKLTREAPDRPWIPDVNGGEAARCHAAEVPPRLDEHHALPHAGRLHGRGHAPRCAAIHGHVDSNVGSRSEGRRERQAQRGNERDESHSILRSESRMTK
jgi:hypothetical protein